MTDMQLYLALGLPILAVLTSLTISLIQISGIRDDVRGVRAEMRDLRVEMRDVRTEMRNDNKQIREEIVGKLELLTGIVYEMRGKDHA